MSFFFTVCVLYTQGMGNKEWREVSEFSLYSATTAPSFEKCPRRFKAVFCFDLMRPNGVMFAHMEEKKNSVTFPTLI